MTFKFPPRDCNWKGDHPTSEDERKEYATRFIAACREKSLDAVAITDHHDICYFPYIRAAAAAEVGLDGLPVPDHHRIVVFPGMELTRAVPCQAILILDADFPEEHLAALHTVLGVVQNGHNEPIHVQAIRLTDFGSLDKACEMLDRLDHFRGRYILLPNVSEGGGSSILRKGFAHHYKNMSCVGGYLDGAVTQLGAGNRGIVEGRNREYGERKIGLFQTSDNRNGDFTELGKHSSWVKWTTPTAEALRQACLAHGTRISHERPACPPMVVSRIEVTDSRFLNEIDLHFNPQYNCLIGGRGTGKSTILEYLRWALCDQPPTYSDEDDVVPYQEKRSALIDKTLVPVRGVVTVSFQLNSVMHVVRRSAEMKELKLKIGTDEFRDCTEQQIRDLLPLQAYSQ